MRIRAEGLSKELGVRSAIAISATSPIFRKTPQGLFESVGTGLFFRDGATSCIITAAHVLHHLNNEVLYIGAEAFIGMSGRFFTSSNDDEDLGFYPLSEQQTSTLEGARFLTSGELDLTDSGRFRYYYSVGFLAIDNDNLEASSRLPPRRPARCHLDLP